MQTRSEAGSARLYGARQDVELKDGEHELRVLQQPLQLEAQVGERLVDAVVVRRKQRVAAVRVSQDLCARALAPEHFALMRDNTGEHTAV